MSEYIRREEAVDDGYLSDWYIASVGDESPVWTDEHIEELLNDFIVFPKDTASADVQPVKHGRWIERVHTPTNGYNYNVPYSTYICSSCGLEIHNDEYSKYVRGIYTNCPVCIARMEVV